MERVLEHCLVAQVLQNMISKISSFLTFTVNKVIKAVKLVEKLVVGNSLFRKFIPDILTEIFEVFFAKRSLIGKTFNGDLNVVCDVDEQRNLFLKLFCCYFLCELFLKHLELDLVI